MEGTGADNPLEGVDREREGSNGSGDDREPLQHASDASDRERDGSDDAGERETEDESGSRVSVVDEQPERPAPPQGADEEDYKYHTYRVYPSGRPDSVDVLIKGRKGG